MKFILALILSLASLTAAYAEESKSEWYSIGEDNDGTIIYIRTADMEKGRSHQREAKVWVKMDHANDKTTTARESKFLFEINCPEQSFKPLTAAILKPGQRIPTVENTPDASSQFIIPGTTIEAVAKDVCMDPTED